MKRIKSVGVAAVATLALGGGIISCQSPDGNNAGNRSTENGQHEKSSSGQKEEPPAESDPFNDGMNDITVKSCSVGDPWQLGESLPVVDLAVTNSSSKTSDYYYEVEVTNKATGERVETLIGSASGVAPGQTVDTGAGNGEEDPLSTKTGSVSGPLTCTLKTADRTAP